ncbi:hypothetical protein niasHS_004048 [Heterodera schachtii]|uniref:Neurotransmitter-gated ion-channel ligand-binding domain-containing protein n=1 Tax=Heterodera schachtii TaxID=97005 RepID=A0ABD2JUG7_HETSC
MCSSTAKFVLIFVYVLFAIFIGPAIFGDSQQRKRTFRVHFYRKPDGPWLSLLNFRVVQQSFDHDLEDETEDGETETAEEDYDDDEEDDGWTIIEFDNSEEKRNTTEEKLREQNDRRNGSGRDEDGKWKEWDIGRDEKEERGKEKGRDGEEDDLRKNGDDQTDNARKMKQGRDKAKEGGRDEEEGGKEKGRDGEEDDRKRIGDDQTDGARKTKQGGRDEEKGLLANDQRPDVALFKQLIIPWVPHRLRHHHHPLHHSHSSQIQGTHTEQSSNGTIIVTEQNVNAKTMPEQNANVSEEVAQRETGTTKTPSTTGGTAKADVKLHLEDILIFGAFVTPSGEETKETATAETENGNGTIWGQDSDQKDDPMAPLRNDTTNSGQKVLLNGTSLGKPTPATTTTGTSTTWAPINEEELAMNQHVDPLGRDRKQLLAQLIARSNNVSDEAEDDELRETYRDLGGSFILPLLKERKYDNKSVPLVFPDVPLRVALSLEVLHLGNFDNFQMEYELDVFVRLRWIDVRLANNFSKPIRIREQKIIDRIWKPDAVFLNSKFSYFHMVTFPNFRMRILPDGHVSFTTRQHFN